MLLSQTLDLIRLIAIPVFIWAAYHDIQTRRVSNKPWLFLGGLGVLLFLLDAILVLSGTTHRTTTYFWWSALLSICILFPFAYLAWFFRLFGGADAKALMALAILFPITPTYTTNLLPFIPDIGVYPHTLFPETIFVELIPFTLFAGVIFINAIFFSILYPVVMFVRNLLSGDFSKAMLFATPVKKSELHSKHGVLFESQNEFKAALDLDVLKQYLQWRATTVEQLSPIDSDDNEDIWGAEQFFNQSSEPTYGMTPDDLTDGLNTISSAEDSVWISPGIPYMVPFAAGLITALVYGNLMVWFVFAMG